MSCQPSQEEKKVTRHEKSRKRRHNDPASMRTYRLLRRSIIIMYRGTKTFCSEFPMDASLENLPPVICEGRYLHIKRIAFQSEFSFQVITDWKCNPDMQRTMLYPRGIDPSLNSLLFLLPLLNPSTFNAGVRSIFSYSSGFWKLTRIWRAHTSHLLLSAAGHLE
jgi:hypothetical protein